MSFSLADDVRLNVRLDNIKLNAWSADDWYRQNQKQNKPKKRRRRNVYKNKTLIGNKRWWITNGKIEIPSGRTVLTHTVVPTENGKEMH